MLNSPQTAIVLMLAAASMAACARSGAPMKGSQAPLACRLDALSPEEQAREGELLAEHIASVVEVRELDDGYSFRYPSDPQLFARMAELVSLEHRCCPFLNFHLEWAGTEDKPWLHVTGGPGVKAFLADAFVRVEGAP